MQTLISKNKTYYKLQNSWHWNIQEHQLILFSSTQFKALKIQHHNLHATSQFLSLLKEGIQEDKIYQIALALELDKLFVDSLYKKLIDKNILIKTLALGSFLEKDELYNRQVKFFNLFEDSKRTGDDLNLQLQNKKVLITGLGGYGTWLTLFCSRMGVKCITGIDFDRVELSNLNRQVLYTPLDIGRLKVDACKEAISHMNPEIEFKGVNLKIEHYQDLLPYLEGIDFVFNAFAYGSFNNPLSSYGAQVALACIERQIPCLNLRGNWIGPLYIPGKSPCYLCALDSISYSRDVSNTGCDMRKKVEIGSFAPFIANTVSYAIWEATNFLCDLPYSNTKSNILMLDRFSTQFYEVFPVQFSKNCKCQFYP